MLNNFCELSAPGGVENSYGKINILLQTYISRGEMDSFSLISDSAYVAQVRISLLSCFSFPRLLLETQEINSWYTMNILHYDMVAITILLQNWFYLICTSFMPSMLLDQKWKWGSLVRLALFDVAVVFIVEF